MIMEQSVKEYLMQIPLLDAEIKQDRIRIDELKLETRRLKSMDCSRSKVQSGLSDSVSGGVTKLADLQNKLIGEVTQLQAQKDVITRQIRKLKDRRYVTLLTLRYVNCARWEEIAVDMGESMRHVFRMHGDALEEFRKLGVMDQ